MFGGWEEGRDKEVRNSFIDQIQRRHFFDSCSTFICDDEHVLISGEYSVRVVHKWRHPEIYTPAGQFSSAEAF